jgi:hypothetical protein
MMPAEDVFRLVTRAEGLRQNLPMTLAADDLGVLFRVLLGNEELEAVFREFKVSTGPSA